MKAINELASIIREEQACTLEYLYLHAKTSFWVIQKVYKFIPEMFPDIEFNAEHKTFRVKEKKPEKTVDPNTLDSTLEQ